MSAARKIVIAVDDSPVSQEAVQWAASKLITPNDEVHIISVLDPGQRPEQVGGESSPYVLEESDCKPNPLQLEKRAEMLKKYRSEICSSSGTKKVHLTTLVSCAGTSGETGKRICEYSAEQKSDLLVMGSRGMGSAKRSIMGLFGLGSVSEFVTRHGQNVLVHRGSAGAPTATA